MAAKVKTVYPVTVQDSHKGSRDKMIVVEKIGTPIVLLERAHQRGIKRPEALAQCKNKHTFFQDDTATTVKWEVAPPSPVPPLSPANVGPSPTNSHVPPKHKVSPPAKRKVSLPESDGESEAVVISSYAWPKCKVPKSTAASTDDAPAEDGQPYENQSVNSQSQTKGGASAFSVKKSPSPERYGLTDSLEPCVVSQSISPSPSPSASTGRKSHTCSECGKNFKKPFNLRVHMMIHTGETPYKCLLCGKKFGREGNLKTHQLTHTGEKPHKCSQCDKQYRQLGHLQKHELTHQAERPHECAHCGKIFTRQDHYQAHIITHTNNKTHKCSLCNKLFFRAWNLKQHLLTHTGKKPHDCAECGAMFSLPSNLKTHMLSHTGDKPYKCAKCGECFPRKDYIQRHMVVHSREEV